MAITYTLQYRAAAEPEWRTHMVSAASGRVVRQGTKLADTWARVRLTVPDVPHNVAEWRDGTRVERIPFARVCRTCWFRGLQREQKCFRCLKGLTRATEFVEYSKTPRPQAAPKRVCIFVPEPLPPARPPRLEKPKRTVILYPHGRKDPFEFEVVFDGAYCE